MAGMEETLRLRVPEALLLALNREARKQMLTTSAYVRLVLAQHVGLIEPPTVLVDPATEYGTEAPCTP